MRMIELKNIIAEIKNSLNEVNSRKNMIKERISEFKEYNTNYTICSGMVVHTCNPSTQEAEARGLRHQDQPGLHGEPEVSLDYIDRKTLSYLVPPPKKEIIQSK
jgi:hypothetical protein